MAAGFLNLGLVKGDRVAIWSPNYEFWYVSMLAIARAGLVCVKYSANEIKDMKLFGVLSLSRLHLIQLTSYRNLTSVFKKLALKRL